ncbi:acyltransferase family protein [Fictibacillus sp. Mic-4]|uniref:acyltransferase family protein n=1 Tax=Fictibacillus sp. Mic-4 TaxID=3132826 RepID=UPI003CEB6F8B
MAKQRIPWFDNMKGILIFLMVFGHLIETYRDSYFSAHYLYNVIYSFHMPLFILISGYFFRPNRIDRIVQVLSVFVIWQLINGVFQKLINDNEIVSFSSDSRIMDIFDPYWAMWFLLGIAVWSAITPYVLRLRYPLLFALGLAIWISYVDDVTKWFSLRKLINFYPYFLIGYYLANKNIVMSLKKRAHSWKQPFRWGAIAIVLAYFGSALFLTKKGGFTELLFMSKSYDYFDWSFLKGGTIQLILYGAITILSIALMLLVPQEKKLAFFNKLGVYSLFIYMIHTNIVRLFRKFETELLTLHIALALVICLLFAAAICWLVTRQPVLNFFKPLIQPKMRWSLKQVNDHSKQKEVAS